MAEKAQVKTKAGKIVSLSVGLDTIKVEVERTDSHNRYEKQIKRHNRYLVHVEESQKEKLNLGQEVTIAETKPYSKRKSWKLLTD